MGYRDLTNAWENWRSEQFSNIRDRIEFESCINEFNKVLDRVGHKIKRIEND